MITLVYIFNVVSTRRRVSCISPKIKISVTMLRSLFAPTKENAASWIAAGVIIYGVTSILPDMHILPNKKAEVFTAEEAAARNASVKQEFNNKRDIEAKAYKGTKEG